MPTFPAHRVATPVLERLDGERAGVVLGAGATACWVDLEGFVVAVTTREVPLLPNAVALAAGSGSLQRAGAAALAAGSGSLQRAGAAAGTVARFAPGRIDLGTLRVTWDPAAPPAWDPTVPEASQADPEALARRGAALLRPRRPGVAGPDALVGELVRVGLPTAADPDGAAGLTRLFHAVRERDPEPAAAAARELLGRGPGLTPEGDDLLAAVAGALAVLGPAAGWDRTVLGGFLATLVGPAAERTTALSATLLQLATRRRLIEPAGRLVDLDPGAEAAWPAALARLERLGHGSGRAYAAGIAATTSLLAGSPVG